MELKVFGDVFSLRDDALNDRLWKVAVDPKQLAQIAQGADSGNVLRADQADTAAALMKRAMDVFKAADFSTEQVAADAASFTTSVLQAATAPLKWDVAVSDPQGGPVAAVAAPANPAKGAKKGKKRR